MTPPPGYRAVLFVGKDQPPAVNAAGKRVCRVCRPLAGAEMQKARTEAGLN